MVRRIQSRGGRVVFVRFPTSGEHWQIDQLKYPKSEFWDLIGGSTVAQTIHFVDHPALRQFELPDTSHLDFSDAATVYDGITGHPGRSGRVTRPVIGGA